LLSLREIGSVLDAFEFLAITKEIRRLYRELMMKHNLKPNDVLILATCKFYGISHFISLDMDFKVSCEKEGITLIDSREKLKKALNVER
jgi:predicted nucleic acid-binding protein